MAVIKIIVHREHDLLAIIDHIITYQNEFWATNQSMTLSTVISFNQQFSKGVYSSYF